MYICTYQDWLFWLITNIFLLEKEIYWNHKPQIKNIIATKTRISHLYFSFFLSSSFWQQSFPSLSSQHFLTGFFLVLFPLAWLASLSSSAISTAFFLLPLLLVLALPLLFFDLLPELASLPRSLSSSAILDFLSPGKNKNKLQQILKTNHLFHQIEKSYCCYIHAAGSEIAPSWSPMRLEIQSWWPEFHSWSPASDL